MNILFMGTPEFAVPSLLRLLADGHRIVCVVTREDKPAGRHSRLQPPPVKVCAAQHGIPVCQPGTLKDGALLPVLSAYAPDLIAVVAYGRILPKYVLEFPKYGCINVHASLLPKYRGAGPIQWAVINGEKKTGVTTQYMAEGLDTGDMLLKKETEIGEEETAGQLHDRLMHIGADLLSETVRQIGEGTALRTPQNDEQATAAPMLTSETGHIDWSRNGNDILNLIRGTNPWPCAHTRICGKRVKVFKAKFRKESHNEQPGRVIRCCEEGIVTACADGFMCLCDIQAECCKRMSACDFLRGNAIETGIVLG